MRVDIFQGPPDHSEQSDEGIAVVPRRARRVQLQRRHQLVRKVRAAISACEKNQQCEKVGRRRTLN